MKHRLRDLLACCSCGSSPLDLTVIETALVPAPAVDGVRCSHYCSWCSEKVEGSGRARPCAECYGTEITQGVLHCDACRRDFPVIDGVPRFNPDVEQDFPSFFELYGGAFRYREAPDLADFRALHAQTKRSFGFQWLRFQVTDHEENRAVFFSRTETKPGSLGSKLFFEAGCGMGRYLQVIGDERPAEVVGLDLSLAVNRAYEEARGRPFIHVVQGDILQLPFRGATFDHVYSIGVLHHTPDMRSSFRSIVKLAKPGGRVSIWVYHVWRPPELHGLKAVHATMKGWIADTLRKVTTRMPLSLLCYLCYIAAPVGWLGRCADRTQGPVRILLSPLLMIPCSIHAKWKVRVLDTFDWYSPRFQWKHTVAEIEDWFREEGLTNISTKGFPVSVRGTVPGQGGTVNR